MTKITDIETRIIDIIAKGLKKPKDSITPETKFFEDLNADSLDAVEQMLNIEDEFGIDFEDSEIGPIVTVQDLINEVKKILG